MILVYWYGSDEEKPIVSFNLICFNAKNKSNIRSFGIPWMASSVSWEHFKGVYNSRDKEKIRNVTR